MTLYLAPWFIQTAVILAKVVFIMSVVMAVGALLSWVERKQSAVMQDRIGANRASIFGIRAIGLVHIISDAIKGITKEDYIPPGSSKFLHSLAPFLACFTAVMAFSVLPFGGSFDIAPFTQVIPNSLPIIGGLTVAYAGAVMNFPLVIAPMPGIAMLFVFAMLGVGVYAVVISGYAADNKFGMLGGLRASAQMVSFEITTGLSIIGAIIFYGTLDFQSMVNQQAGEIWRWGVFWQPLGFILFFVATIVESKRVPFDLPEAESEIIGYFIEYSGMKFLLFFMAEFIECLLFAWLIVLIFLGGWHFPGLHNGTELGTGINFFGSFYELAGWIVALLQGAVFTAKLLGLLFVQMLIRWSVPRFRFDQIMTLGWKIMLPLAIFNIGVSAFCALLFKG